MTAADLRSHIETTEESYEFFLAYAAQGARDDRESPSGAQLRDFLAKISAALEQLGRTVPVFVEAQKSDPPGAWREFAATLAADAARARAAVDIVAAQTAISSQLVDNLNASIHIRALLTDLFLLDELLKTAT